MEAHRSAMKDAFHFVRRPNPWKRRLLAPRPATTSSIAFTFDDGPDATETPRILNLLKERGIRATFFLLGKCIAGNEAIVQRMIEEGHTLGNHSFTHPQFSIWDFRSPYRELAECQGAIEAMCGHSPEVARPPFGKCTPGFRLAAARLRLKVQLWSLDSGDWQCRSQADAERCAKELRSALCPGDTILFHDNHRWIVPILETFFSEPDTQTTSVGASSLTLQALKN